MGRGGGGGGGGGVSKFGQSLRSSSNFGFRLNRVPGIQKWPHFWSASSSSHRKKFPKEGERIRMDEGGKRGKDRRLGEEASSRRSHEGGSFNSSSGRYPSNSFSERRSFSRDRRPPSYSASRDDFRRPSRPISSTTRGGYRGRISSRGMRGAHLREAPPRRRLIESSYAIRKRLPPHFIKLSCPHCNIKCVTFNKYGIHLHSSQHMTAMHYVAMKQKSILARMRLTQRNAQRELEKSTEDLAPRTNFCPLCKLNYNQPKAAHQAAEDGKLDKNLSKHCKQRTHMQRYIRYKEDKLNNKDPHSKPEQKKDSKNDKEKNSGDDEENIDDKLWADDVNKDLGDILAEAESGNKSSDEDADAAGQRYDRFRYSEKNGEENKEEGGGKEEASNEKKPKKKLKKLNKYPYLTTILEYIC
ncbi:hypothetical protein RI129_008609 [Pyrocoelia pectoralis]|uniref:Uncharacterized protein n=1 Tax=Pyrocoelia pectoralis TaxID=417401 RepID=A0AAN7ZHJ5_9COLE